VILINDQNLSYLAYLYSILIINKAFIIIIINVTKSPGYPIFAILYINRAHGSFGIPGTTGKSKRGYFIEPA